MRLDLVGQKFGRLFVLEEAATRPKWRRYFLCKCDCGTVKEVSMSNLRSGSATSCGCFANEEFGKRNTTHGMVDTPNI